MNLQELDATTILIIAAFVVFLFLLISASSGGGSASSRRESGGYLEDDFQIPSSPPIKACPRCGTMVEPTWGDYYHCSECGFGFTGTGRWTNGHMPGLLLKPSLMSMK